MPTPKQLAIRALRRTTDAIVHDVRQFPLDRWHESPGGEANDLFGVLLHLIQCGPWWLLNIGMPGADRTPLPGRDEYQSAEQMLETFRKGRDHLLGILEERPDEFFENPVPDCHYGHLHSGTELFLYAAEHDFYHVGQINMLQMALAKPGEDTGR